MTNYRQLLEEYLEYIKEVQISFEHYKMLRGLYA